MKELVTFFNTLRNNAGAIWVDQGMIKLSTPKQMQNEETKQFLTQRKKDIVKILTDNSIVNKELFFHKVILKDTLSTNYPLSHAQERLWFIEQYQEGTNAYHIPWIMELEEGTDIEGIKYALQQIVARHEVLRTTIEQRDDQAVQAINTTALEIVEMTLNEEEYYIQIKEDIKRPFKLSSEYPIRVRIYTVISSSGKQTGLLINIHHIASDGWSTSVFRKEMTAYYEAFVRKDLSFRLPELEIQYKDYAVWQRAYISGETLEKQIIYWREKLEGYQVLELPTDKPRPNAIDYRGAREQFILPASLSKKLRALVRSHGTTLHSVILSGLNVLFGKYTGQEDIVIGSTIANRHHRQTEGLIGFFVNTQVNRSKLNKNQSFNDLIDQVHKDQTEIQLHQDLPFEKLINELGVERDMSRHPIFQVMFGVHGFKNDEGEEELDDEIEDNEDEITEEAEDKVAKFDLSIHVNGNGDEITGSIGYATSLFHKTTILRLIKHFEYLLQQLTDFPDRAYSTFSLIRPEELEQIIHTWNQTDVQFPSTKTVHALFEEQAERTPDAIAAMFQDEHLTYRQLSERSSQLAHHIRKCSKSETLRPGTLVALCVAPGLDLAIGILGILKAGGAYVPIDISYPRERIEYILTDTQAGIIVLQQTVKELLGIDSKQDEVVIINLSDDPYQHEPATLPASTNSADDLAYIIYTSGTTGKPKGAMISHRSVANYNHWMTNHSIFANAKRVDCSSSISFDATVNVLVTPLCSGQTVVLCPARVKQDVSRYLEYLRKNEVELIKVTPSYFSLLLGIIQDHPVPSLKCVIMGGEKANKYDLLQFMERYPNINILHHYGPTETTVGITSFTDFNDSFFLNQMENVPLGKVASNNRAYVLNAELKPVPIGTIGELYIGGVNLAKGYWNKPEITGQKFINNPYATITDKEKGYTRLYKTGDLVKWLENGNLEFIGRNDDQVKIRGYRIELGEIEHFLKQLPGVLQACVIVKERRTEGGVVNYLVGYFVTDDPEVTESSLLNQLIRLLPEYMIPSALVKLEKLPLNINGKLDKRLLPDPDFVSTSQDYTKPVNALEESVCNIWEQVIGVKQVGTTDDFFRIGGNSILAILVSHRMSKALGMNIKVADIFKYKTIKSLLENSTVSKIDDNNVEWEF